MDSEIGSHVNSCLDGMSQLESFRMHVGNLHRLSTSLKLSVACHVVMFCGAVN